MGIDVFDPTVAAIDDCRQAHGQYIVDWTAGRSLKRVLSIHSVERARRRLEGITGSFRQNVECACDGVVAEESTLRTLQYLDSVYIEERVGAATRAAMIDVVDESSDRLIKGLLIPRTDAANVHVTRRASRGNMHRRDNLTQVLQVAQVLIDQLLTADHLRGDRHAL